MTKRLSIAVAGDMVDWTSSGVTVKGGTANNKWQYSGDGTNVDWALSFQGSVFGGTGNGTFNHGCKQFGAAAAPSVFPMNSYSGPPPGSQTLGCTSITTTQVTVTTGAGLAWKLQGRA